VSYRTKKVISKLHYEILHNGYKKVIPKASLRYSLWTAVSPGTTSSAPSAKKAQIVVPLPSHIAETNDSDVFALAEG